MVTTQEIRNYMSKGHYDLDDIIVLTFDTKEVNLQCDKENDIQYDVVSIDYMVLSIDRVLEVLENDTNTSTIDWKGTVIKKIETVSKPAYGGFSNTNGIPEMGELYVDRKLIEKGTIDWGSVPSCERRGRKRGE